jgi:transcription initiation factor IIE alpha subunit
MGSLVKDMLDILTRRGEVTIDEIAEELEIDKDKASSIIYTLRDFGFIEVIKENEIIIKLSSDTKRLLT